MRLALLADLHANLEALTACLAHARSQGAEALAFLGDLVGYGPDPAAVVERVAEHASRGALVVRGNHEAAVLAPAAEGMSRTAEQAVDWTRAQLGAAHRAFLAALPLVVRSGDALLVHASAEEPNQWVYLGDASSASRCLAAAAPARYVFCGHVHAQVLYHAAEGARPVPFAPVPGVPIPTPPRRRWLAIAGSAGQPRDGRTAACYAIADRERGTITFFRVPYDWTETARKVRAAGLPEALARRLERGE